MEFITAIFTIYGVLCVIFTTFFLINFVRNLRREISLIEDVKKIKQTVKLVYIEHSDGYSYMYDRITNQFICSADSDEAVLNRAQEIFPNFLIDVKSQVNQ